MTYFIAFVFIIRFSKQVPMDTSIILLPYTLTQPPEAYLNILCVLCLLRVYTPTRKPPEALTITFSAIISASLRLCGSNGPTRKPPEAYAKTIAVFDVLKIIVVIPWVLPFAGGIGPGRPRIRAISGRTAAPGPCRT